MALAPVACDNASPNNCKALAAGRDPASGFCKERSTHSSTTRSSAASSALRLVGVRLDAQLSNADGRTSSSPDAHERWRIQSGSSGDGEAAELRVSAISAAARSIAATSG
eukprot:scaffold272675_cov31-Tisochrysis_lutea.AAC.3